MIISKLFGQPINYFVYQTRAGNDPPSQNIHTLIYLQKNIYNTRALFVLGIFHNDQKIEFTKYILLKDNKVIKFSHTIYYTR